MNKKKLSIEIETLKYDIEDLRHEQKVSNKRIGYCLRKLSKLKQKQKSNKEEVA